MRVLVAGDRGYIGAFWCPSCVLPGTRSTGSTSASTRGATSAPARRTSAPRPPSDIRDAQPGQLAGYDAVVCLAALSNDPLGHLNPAATYSVNLEGRCTWPGQPSRRASSASCSPRPAACTAPRARRGVAEDAELFPVTPYGESKVLAERSLSQLADDPSARPTFATPPPTAPRPGSGWTSWSTTSPRRDDHRAGAPGKRRVALAAAGAYRGHQPGVPRRAGGTA